MTRAQIRAEIRRRISELARALGQDASNLRDDDVIPVSGLLDSAALLELVVWCERRFDVAVKDGELTIDSFGTVTAMIDFVAERTDVSD